MTSPRLWQILWAHSDDASYDDLQRCSLLSPSTTIRIGDDAPPQVLTPLQVHLNSESGDPAALAVELSAQWRDGSLHIESCAVQHMGASIGARSRKTSSGLECYADPVDIAVLPAMRGTGDLRGATFTWNLDLRSDNLALAFAADGESEPPAIKPERSVLKLKGELRPLELLADVKVSRGRGVNVLGNFGARIADSEDADEGWLRSAHETIQYTPSKIEITLAQDCDVHVVSADHDTRFEGKKQGRTVQVELGPLTHGRHSAVIRAFAKGGEMGARAEEVHVPIESQFPIYANLPVARRFVKTVDITDGHLTLSAADLRLEAGGSPLEFIRTYSNLAAASEDSIFPVSGLGVGWTHNFNSWIDPLGGDSAKRYLAIGGEGSGKVYVSQTPGELASGTGGYHGVLIKQNDEYILTTPGGVRYHYARQAQWIDGRNYLVATEDANGNITRIDRRQDGRVNRVYDSSNLRHIRFFYSETEPGLAGHVVLTSIRVFEGDKPLDPDLTVAFSHDQLGNLTLVKRDLRSHTYGYAAGTPSPHRVVRYTDPDLHTTAYEYRPRPSGIAPDAHWEMERVASVTESQNRVTKFDYKLESHTQNGQTVLVPVRTEVSFPGTQTPPTQYFFDPKDASGLITKIEEAGGQVIEFSWDPKTRLLKTERDASGRKFQYEYDVAGNPTRQWMLLDELGKYYKPITSAAGQVEKVGIQSDYTERSRLNRSGWGEVAGGVDREVHRKEYQYDNRGNLTLESEPDSADAAATRTTTYKYDKSNLISKSRSDGEQVTYADYTALGQPKTLRRLIEGSRVLITRQLFDSRGRLTETRDEIPAPDEAHPVVVHRVAFEYDNLDQIKKKTEYNGFGKQLMGDLATADHVTLTEYTPGGVLKERTEIGPANQVVLKEVWDYDALGRLQSLTQSPAPGETLVTQYKYDTFDRVIWQKDRRGNIWTHAYDVAGRLTTVSLQQGAEFVATEKYTYSRTTNEVESFTDYLNNTTRYEYDTLLRMCKRTLPTGDVETFQQDSRGNLVEKTEAGQAKTQYRYNNFDERIEEVDPKGNSKTFRYDRDGKLVFTQDSTAGLTTVLGYDGLNRLVSQTETLLRPLSQTFKTSYVHDDARHLVTIQKPFIQFVVEEYRDDRGLLVKRIVDPKPGVLSPTHFFKYDSLGNLVEEQALIDANRRAVKRYEVDGLGRRRAAQHLVGNDQWVKETFTYDGEGNQLRHTDRVGNTSVRELDAHARVVAESIQGPQDPQPRVIRKVQYFDQFRQSVSTDGFGAWTQTWSDGLGRPVTVVTSEYPTVHLVSKYEGPNLKERSDGRQNTTSFEYDALRRLTAAHLPLGLTETMEYRDTQGLIVAMDRKKIQTITKLDSKGRQIEQSRANQVQWTRTYDGEGRLTQETDAKGHATRYEYDATGSVIRIHLPGGRIIRYEYDLAGNRTREWLADVAGLPADRAMEYDNLGRMTKTTDAAGYSTEYRYNAEGRITWEQDAEGLITTYDYDSLGNVTGITRDPGAINAKYTYQYDPAARLSQVLDPTKVAHRFTYDGLGRRRKRILVADDGQQVETAHEFDGNGNLIAVSHPNGSRCVWEYDALNRLNKASVDKLGASVSIFAQEMKYALDANGNILSVASTKNWLGAPAAPDSHTVTYDDLNRPLSELTPLGQKIVRTYDANGLPLTVAFGGIQLTYEHDERNRLKSVASPLGSFTYDYDAADRIKAMSLPGGYSTELTREPNGWIKKVAHKEPGGRALLEYVYTLNRVGDPAQIVVTSPSGATTRTLEYDTLHRLKSEKFGDSHTEYRYDAAGRRIAEVVNESQNIYRYDNFGRLKSVSNAQNQPLVLMDHRPGGELSERWQAGRLIRLGYNPWQQLVQAEWGDAAGLHAPLTKPEQTLLDYDYRSRRLKRIGPSAASSRGYLYDGANRIADLQWVSGYPLARAYLRGQGLLGVVEQNGGVRQLRLALQDRLGSVTRLESLNNMPSQAQEFSAFGTLASLEGPASAPIGFTGGWNEAIGSDPAGDTPLLHPQFVQLGERVYDPMVGQFWSTDSEEIAEAHDVLEDRYVYAHNRPALYIDPSGRHALADLAYEEGRYNSPESDPEPEYNFNLSGDDHRSKRDDMDLHLDPEIEKEMHQVNVERTGQATSVQDGVGIAHITPEETLGSIGHGARQIGGYFTRPLAGAALQMRTQATVVAQRGPGENGVSAQAGVTDSSGNYGRALSMMGWGVVELGLGFLAGPEVLGFYGATRVVRTVGWLWRASRAMGIGHGIGTTLIGGAQLVTASSRTSREDEALNRANVRGSMPWSSPGALTGAAIATVVGADPAKGALYGGLTEASGWLTGSVVQRMGGFAIVTNVRGWLNAGAGRAPGLLTQMRRLIYDSREWPSIVGNRLRSLSSQGARAAAGSTFEHLFITQASAARYAEPFRRLTGLRLSGFANSYLNSGLEITRSFNSMTRNYASLRWAERAWVAGGAAASWSGGQRIGNYLSEYTDRDEE